MKKNSLVFVLVFLLSFKIVQAQSVGISDVIITPDPASLLELRSTNKGLLIPRVALTQTTSNAPVGAGIPNSLLVYNTATVNDVIPGFYYWENGLWVRMGAGVSTVNAWDLMGNSATNPSVNFLGTTDAVDLVLRTDDTERIRVTSSGNVGVGTSVPGHKLHVAGGLNSGNIRLDNMGAIVWGTSGGSFLDGVLRLRSDNSFQIRGAGIRFLNGGNNQVAIIDNTGNLGINVDPPGARLHVDGSVRFEGLSTSTETTALVMDANSNVSTRQLNDLAFIDGNNDGEMLYWDGSQWQLQPARVEPHYSTFTDSRDFNTYKTIRIGQQIWMAENLRYLPAVSPPNVGSNNEVIPHYYVYGYSGTDVDVAKKDTNYHSYGVLYNFAAAITSCPAGWKLPSQAEWQQMIDFIGGHVNGNTLKARRQVNHPYTSCCKTNIHPRFDADITNGNFGTDIYGFYALPGGYRSGAGFSGLGDYAQYRTSTINGTGAWRRWTRYSSNLFTQGASNEDRAWGVSVRCIKE